MMNDPGPEHVRKAVHELYRRLDSEVADAGPVCVVSGRCCRFAEYGHTLFLSAVEFALLISEAPPPVRPIDDGATCPWQDAAGRCQARDARPLGCRVYFCDPSFQERASSLSEQHLKDLKRLIAELGLRWDYAPLHTHLSRAVAAGQLVEAAEQQPGA